ncbi:MAG: FliH/SctL family protein [Acidobacteriota bacterium]|nr:FliH/SctL family protein [Acidobacteriota bacterium]
MSRKIYKQGKSPDSSPFQFQPSYTPTGEEGLSDLEAQAELDAFQDSGSRPSRSSGNSGGAPSVDVEELIERARKDADHIVSRANAEAAAVEREAYEKGLEEGRKTGELMAEQQMQAMLSHYHQSLTALDQARALMLDQMQLDILDLVLATTRKLVNTELRANPHAILSMIKEAIQTLKQRKNLTIYLNAEDHHFTMSISETERQSWLGTQVALEVDPQLTRGSFRIETASGELDAEIDTRLNRLAEDMRQAFENL